MFTIAPRPIRFCRFKRAISDSLKSMTLPKSQSGITIGNAWIFFGNGRF